MMGWGEGVVQSDGWLVMAGTVQWGGRCGLTAPAAAARHIIGKEGLGSGSQWQYRVQSIGRCLQQ